MNFDASSMNSDNIDITTTGFDSKGTDFIAKTTTIKTDTMNFDASSMNSDDINIETTGFDSKGTDFIAKTTTIKTDTMNFDASSMNSDDIDITTTSFDSKGTDFVAKNMVLKTETFTTNASNVDSDNINIQANTLGIYDTGFAYRNMSIDLVGTTAASLEIDDKCRFIQETDTDSLIDGFVQVNGNSPDDHLNLGISALDSLVTLTDNNKGLLKRSNVQLGFAGIENLTTGSANDTIHFEQGGGMTGVLDTGLGANTAINSSGDSLSWKLNGSNILAVQGHSNMSAPIIKGIGSIVGSEQGDELIYSDPQVHGFWHVTADNKGDLNGVNFENIVRSVHHAPGGYLDLAGKMESLDIQGDTTLTVLLGGYYMDITFGSGFRFIDTTTINTALTEVPPIALGSDSEDAEPTTQLSAFLSASTLNSFMTPQDREAKATDAEEFADYVSTIMEDLLGSSLMADSSQGHINVAQQDDSQESDDKQDGRDQGSSKTEGGSRERSDDAEKDTTNEGSSNGEGSTNGEGADDADSDADSKENDKELTS